MCKTEQQQLLSPMQTVQITNPKQAFDLGLKRGPRSHILRKHQLLSYCRYNWSFLFFSQVIWKNLTFVHFLACLESTI